jgi:hypothetical protein
VNLVSIRIIGINSEISIVYLIKIETGLEHEGYVSRGRKAEEGRIAGPAQPGGADNKAAAI